MSIFAQDIDSAVWQSMVDCGSSFHNEILQPVSDNLYGSYDGQTLKVWSKNGMGNYVVSINEHEDLFRNYLPSLSCIQSQNMCMQPDNLPNKYIPGLRGLNWPGARFIINCQDRDFTGKNLIRLPVKHYIYPMLINLIIGIYILIALVV